MKYTCETTLSPAAKAPLVPTLADRRLECEARVPREIDPGVLRHLGDEGVDQWPAHGLCVDRGKMRLRQHVAHHARGFAGVAHAVVNNTVLLLRPQFLHLVRYSLELRYLPLFLVVAIAQHGDRFDHPHVQLACDDRRGHKPAARDADDRLERAGLMQAPCERARVAMKLVPGNGKDLVRTP